MWEIEFHDAFEPEFEALPESVQDRLLKSLILLRRAGPALGRPHADTLAGARHANLKELRFKADDGAWRVAFVFDPRRRGIILVAANKIGMSQQRFYRDLIAKAEQRYDAHLLKLTERKV